MPPTQQPWQQGVGLFGSTLKDIAAQLQGNLAAADNVTQFQQAQRANALRNAYAMAATASGSAARQTAYAAILANGGDPSGLMKYRSAQELPGILSAMQPKEVSSCMRVRCCGRTEWNPDNSWMPTGVGAFVAGIARVPREGIATAGPRRPA